MFKRLARVLESPLLLVLLLLTVGGLALAWQRVDAQNAAPTIPGYDWAKHPNALLIIEPSDACNTCGLPLSDWVLAGIAHKLDVVVVTQRPVAESRDLQLLQKQFFSPRLFVTQASTPQLFQQFSPHGKTGVALIRNGRIVHQAQGAMPNEAFWNQKEVKS